eukprot:TRINITY_DN5056_c0_g1_i2.p1 TRINITY_DN5056_c0_g1~~TRINITY_DN5056_c0_g1_i2.p1  ORF type:complete len:508 (+),score=74.25 TRINITY_DN5056_c0_g1_i2:244-1767(+)
MFKNQLQELAQRTCQNLPSYAGARAGPGHAPKFKATVTFNNESFESPDFFPTLRQAEHAAAEVALAELAKRGPSQLVSDDTTGICKNLLQETAQKAGVPLPNYSTTRSGPGHLPVFTCTVEIAGLHFVGDAARTKKQAEKNAAMAAWSDLKTYALKRFPSFSVEAAKDLSLELEQTFIAKVLAQIATDESNPFSKTTATNVASAIIHEGAKFRSASCSRLPALTSKDKLSVAALVSPASWAGNPSCDNKGSVFYGVAQMAGANSGQRVYQGRGYFRQQQQQQQKPQPQQPQQPPLQQPQQPPLQQPQHAYRGRGASAGHTGISIKPGMAYQGRSRQATASSCSGPGNAGAPLGPARTGSRGVFVHGGTGQLQKMTEHEKDDAAWLSGTTYSRSNSSSGRGYDRRGDDMSKLYHEGMGSVVAGDARRLVAAGACALAPPHASTGMSCGTSAAFALSQPARIRTVQPVFAAPPVLTPDYYEGECDDGDLEKDAAEHAEAARRVLDHLSL